MYHSAESCPSQADIGCLLQNGLLLQNQLDTSTTQRLHEMTLRTVKKAFKACSTGTGHLRNVRIAHPLCAALHAHS